VPALSYASEAVHWMGDANRCEKLFGFCY